MEDGNVVHIKVFDEKKGDVVFEGKVSTDIEPHELTYLGCFVERFLNIFYKKATNERVESFKGLQKEDVELFAGVGSDEDFSGVLYVGTDDVLRKSKSVPLGECVMMSVWDVSQEECEKAFKCETLEVLEINSCNQCQIPNEIGKMSKLKKLTLFGLDELNRIPEEIGDLANLIELRIGYCGIGDLPKRLKELKFLHSINLFGLDDLKLHPEDVVVFSRLKRLKIKCCKKSFTSTFVQAFCAMIKSTVELRFLELGWEFQVRDQGIVAAALKENGSIVEGEWYREYEEIFKRNKDNHEKARECVVFLLAIRRCRDALSHVPKEMIRMIAMMLWNTRCNVEAWGKK